jgi:hypothetical protein
MSKVNFQTINPVTQYLRSKKAVVNNASNYLRTKEFYSKTGDFIMWQGRDSRVTRDFSGVDRRTFIKRYVLDKWPNKIFTQYVVIEQKDIKSTLEGFPEEFARSIKTTKVTIDEKAKTMTKEVIERELEKQPEVVEKYNAFKLDEKPKYVEKSHTITTEEGYVPLRRHRYGIFE